MSEVHLAGVDGYEFTASFLAWAAQQPVSGTGALGPVEAYGLERLEAGARLAGLERVRWLVSAVIADELIPQPHELVLRNGVPDTIAGWKALGDGLLTDQPCAFHRNIEISSRYAWLYKFLPAYFKWAGMAAFASHHVRLALFRSGWTPIAPATWTSRTACVARRRC